MNFLLLPPLFDRRQGTPFGFDGLNQFEGLVIDGFR